MSSREHDDVQLKGADGEEFQRTQYPTSKYETVETVTFIGEKKLKWCGDVIMRENSRWMKKITG